jgi:hypothetical protein
MTPQKGKKFRTSEGAERVQRLEVTNPHAAGIDVHSAVHFVAVNPADVPAAYVAEDPQLPAGVRKFGAFTCDLEALAAWLKDCHVKTIAMESTGVYWIPLFELLERRLRPANRVLDRFGLIPPKGGYNHDPWCPGPNSDRIFCQINGSRGCRATTGRNGIERP